MDPEVEAESGSSLLMTSLCSSCDAKAASRAALDSLSDGSWDWRTSVKTESTKIPLTHSRLLLKNQLITDPEIGSSET